MALLYGHPLSGNTHKVRLALSLLEVKHEEVTVDLSKPREASFLAYVERPKRANRNGVSGIRSETCGFYFRINPLGQVPVFKDDSVLLRDSAAILTYLAQKYRYEVNKMSRPKSNSFPHDFLLFA